MLEENVPFHSTIKVQTYFIAARMVAKGAGICVVDKYTALGNLHDDIAFASFEPKLSFNVSVLHLDNRRISRAAQDFIPYLTSEIS